MRQSIKDKGLQMSLFTRDHLVFALQKHELGTKLQIIILFMVPNFASSVSTHTHDSNNKLETGPWCAMCQQFIRNRTSNTEIGRASPISVLQVLF